VQNSAYQGLTSLQDNRVDHTFQSNAYANPARRAPSASDVPDDARSLFRSVSMSIIIVVGRFRPVNQWKLFTPPPAPKMRILAQTILLSPESAICFSVNGTIGIPQAGFTDIVAIDNGDRAIVLKDKNVVNFAIAVRVLNFPGQVCDAYGFHAMQFPGCPQAIYPLPLSIYDEPPRSVIMDGKTPIFYHVERPLSLKEIASGILGIFTTWFISHSFKASRVDPYSSTSPKGLEDVRLDQILLARAGPAVGGDGSLWVAEFFVKS
jgi:hypothetical protein